MTVAAALSAPPVDSSQVVSNRMDETYAGYHCFEAAGITASSLSD
jgi:hypothetical protein